MLANIDLTPLSEISTTDKTFLSLYISRPKSLQNLEKNIERIRRVLKSNETEKDEREHFEENVNAVKKYLKKNPLKSGSLCIYEIMELFFEQERQSEQDLWEKIRSEYLRNGLGIVGIANVLNAVKSGQAEAIIVNRYYQASGKRCRACENLEVGNVNICPGCGSDSLFTVDLVNEIVEAAKQSSTSVNFCDTIESLKDAGEIAAFIRYKN